MIDQPERWADVIGYEKLYRVSTHGRVYSLISDKYMSLVEHGDGYYIVKLYKNKLNHNKRVHRLVAKAFISNENNLPMINHIDLDKKNNNINNLEWCTTAQNNQHYHAMKNKFGSS